MGRKDRAVATSKGAWKNKMLIYIEGIHPVQKYYEGETIGNPTDKLMALSRRDLTSMPVDTRTSDAQFKTQH